MKRASILLGTSPDDIELAFYEALNQANIDQLMACWAEDDDVVCVHPGGQRLIGIGAIRSGFEALFANGGVQARPERVHRIMAVASAVHHLIECVAVRTPQGEQTAWVSATNVYHQTPQGWRLVLHHASPGAPRAPSELSTRPTVLH